MAGDVTLHDGREVVINEFAISHKEYKAIVAGTLTDTQEEAILAKCCGMSVEQIGELPERDWRLMIREILKKISAPNPT